MADDVADKFTVKIDFRADHRQYEDGNTHSRAKLGISGDRVLRWREAGWVDVDGMEPGPEAKPGPVKIQPRDIEIGSNNVKRGKS
ncbi:hypothetical protein J2T57_002611 [Natronocella acetinitrilica]|uniref:Uncharacterized protein n=1 Tax=Natronocella acetinitrilica TaxID=414046 RepID=A0AAE3G673_9GAMM|nr:hypothetical protein [Natronocella acetinitrilica]MCP1675461.1 hypothetical protein [Natronocella acetinitrilica]